MFYHVTYDAYSHYVWAVDEPHAKQIAKKLKFEYKGESSDPREYRPSILAKNSGLGGEDVLHSICFLTFLAHRQGIIGPSDAYGDKAPLHALIHYRQFGSDHREYKHQVAKGIIFLEDNVLGIPPKSIKLNGYKYDQKYEAKPSDLNQPFDVDEWITK